MRLNLVELLAMNNPVRRIAQQKIEFKIFLELLRQAGVDLRNKRILDLACGSGYSLRLLRDEFDPVLLLGFDLMPSQVMKAKKHLGFRTRLFEGDLLRLGLKEEAFDAVFGFGILHHLSDWKKGLTEAVRVLKKGGYLILEEPNQKAVAFFRENLGFAIPESGEFEWEEFLEEVRANGLEVLATKQILFPCFQAFLFQKKTGITSSRVSAF